MVLLSQRLYSSRLANERVSKRWVVGILFFRHLLRWVYANAALHLLYSFLDDGDYRERLVALFSEF